MDFEHYSRTFLHFHDEKIPELLVSNLSSGGSSLVDLGAGDGALLVGLKMKGLLSSFSRIIAVDISKERCDRLARYTNFEVICSDVTEIQEIDTDSVDNIICTQVIEHVDQDKLLSEITRILKPGGRLYIASLIKKWYGWWYYRTVDGKWAIDPNHLREYSSKEEFEHILTRVGLRINKTMISSLRLSVAEFLLRRLIVPIFKPKNVNGLFLKHPLLNLIRRKIYVHPPGYFIIEVTATK